MPLKNNIEKLLFLLLIVSALAQEPGSFNDIDFLSYGYDVFSGFPYPFTELGPDPGFKYASIFFLNNTSGQRTADGRFSIPDGTEAQKLETCLLTFGSEIVQNEKELKHSLTTRASMEIGATFEGISGSFKSSEEYKTMVSDLNTKEYNFIISTSECKVYRAEIDSKRPPPLTRDFVEDTKSLLVAPFIKENYLEFIRRYGTHFIKRLTMGAELIVIWIMQKDTYTHFESETDSITNEASEGAYNATVTSSSGSEEEDSNRTTSKYNLVKYRVSTIGSKPPTTDRQESGDWSTQAFDNPMPVEYTLQIIATLFSDEFWENEDIGDLNLTAISEEMRKYIFSYCVEEVLTEQACTMEPVAPLSPKLIQFQTNDSWYDEVPWINRGYGKVENDNPLSVFTGADTTGHYIQSFLFQDKIWLYDRMTYTNQSLFYVYDTETYTWNYKFIIDFPSFQNRDYTGIAYNGSDVLIVPTLTRIFILIADPTDIVNIIAIDELGNTIARYELSTFLPAPLSVDAIYWDDSLIMTGRSNDDFAIFRFVLNEAAGQLEMYNFPELSADTSQCTYANNSTYNPLFIAKNDLYLVRSCENYITLYRYDSSSQNWRNIADSSSIVGLNSENAIDVRVAVLQDTAYFLFKIADGIFEYLTSIAYNIDTRAFDEPKRIFSHLINDNFHPDVRRRKNWRSLFGSTSQHIYAIFGAGYLSKYMQCRLLLEDGRWIPKEGYGAILEGFLEKNYEEWLPWLYLDIRFIDSIQSIFYGNSIYVLVKFTDGVRVYEIKIYT